MGSKLHEGTGGRITKNGSGRSLHVLDLQDALERCLRNEDFAGYDHQETLLAFSSLLIPSICAGCLTPDPDSRLVLTLRGQRCKWEVFP